MAISYIEAETHCASCQSVVHINALTNKLVCAACHEPVRVWVNVFEDIGRPFHDCAYPATSEMPVAENCPPDSFAPGICAVPCSVN